MSICCTEFPLPWLGLFLGIFWFSKLSWMSCFSSLLSQQAYCWHIERLLSFVCNAPCNFTEHAFSSTYFWWRVLRSLKFLIMSSANGDDFTSSLHYFSPFVPFSCSTALTKTSSTIVNKSEAWTPLSCDFVGDALDFSPFSRMLAISLP